LLRLLGVGHGEGGTGCLEVLLVVPNCEKGEFGVLVTAEGCVGCLACLAGGASSGLGLCLLCGENQSENVLHKGVVELKLEMRK